MDMTSKGCKDWTKRMQEQIVRQAQLEEEVWDKREEGLGLQMIVSVCLGIILIALAVLWLSWGELNAKKELARFDRAQAEKVQQEAEFQKFLRGEK